MTKTKNFEFTLFATDILERSHAYFCEFAASKTTENVDEQYQNSALNAQKQQQIETKISNFRSKMFQ